MRPLTKVLPLLLTLVFTSASFSYAAEAPKKGYDKYGKPLPGTDPAFNPPVTGSAPPAVAEGNKLQGSVTVQPPPQPSCPDFEFSGDQQRPVFRGAGYQCPPGYHCQGYPGYVCKWDFGGNTSATMTASDPNCRYSLCSEQLPTR